MVDHAWGPVLAHVMVIVLVAVTEHVEVLVDQDAQHIQNHLVRVVVITNKETIWQYH